MQCLSLLNIPVFCAVLEETYAMWWTLRESCSSSKTPKYFIIISFFNCVTISIFILLRGNFLLFDWLNAEVFQLNLKYLDVKITVTMATQNHLLILLHELCKNGGKISRF